MKKLTIFLLIGLIVGLSACSTTPQTPVLVTTAPEVPAQMTTALEGKPIIAVSLPALDNPLMLAFQDAFTKTCGDKYDVQVSSADGNANNQATQIENYTAMKPEFLFVMAVGSAKERKHIRIRA
jgi:ABC-type sugar transport system substrate-binding protein